MSRKFAAAPGGAPAVAAIAVIPAHAAATKTVSVSNNAFSPTTVSIHKGDKVTWKWTQGGGPPNLWPPGGGKGPATSSKKGFTFTKSFSKAGTYKYICTIHPSQMK